MKSELILIANAATARLFCRLPDGGALQAVATLQHPESRQKAGALGAERAGHGSFDGRPGGVAFEPRLDARRKEHRLFAEEVAERVEREFGTHRYAGLVLFASSPFLGELRQRLGPQAAQGLHATVDADLTSFAVDEIQRRANHELQARPG